MTNTKTMPKFKYQDRVNSSNSDNYFIAMVCYSVYMHNEFWYCITSDAPDCIGNAEGYYAESELIEAIN